MYTSVTEGGYGADEEYLYAGKVYDFPKENM